MGNEVLTNTEAILFLFFCMAPVAVLGWVWGDDGPEVGYHDVPGCLNALGYHLRRTLLLFTFTGVCLYAAWWIGIRGR